MGRVFLLEKVSREYSCLHNGLFDPMLRGNILAKVSCMYSDVVKVRNHIGFLFNICENTEDDYHRC